ncbi:MAG: hypothetical protein JSU61_12415 [Fidelibacterota bacterium]|nr:MAG: hypothetical protein JSU61_12415 [Candidatus Neomarinimicrobiota bacterium]
MKITHFFLLLFFVLAGLVISSCGKEAATGITTLKVVATGNIWGEIEPCG